MRGGIRATFATRLPGRVLDCRGSPSRFMCVSASVVQLESLGVIAESAVSIDRPCSREMDKASRLDRATTN